MRLLTEFNLHSNLVIFKFETMDGKVAVEYLFTFQSGDIQIYYVIIVEIPIKNIYIPIW